MKGMIRGLLIVSLVIVFQAMPAQATINKIVGDVCSNCGAAVEYPIRQGQTTTVTVEGQFVDLSTALEVTGSGVTVSNAGTASSKKSISIVVGANAAPGLRTVKLRYAVELNGPDTFKILVVRSGRVTNVAVPSPSQFFNSVDIVLTGEKIDNAGVVASSFNPQPIGAEIVGDNLPTRAVIRLRFGSLVAEASGTIFLYDKSCELCGNSNSLSFSKLRYAGIDGDGKNNVSIIGPNAVSEITFPNGNSVRVGSLLAIKIKLVRPAKASTSRSSPIITIGSTGGETVHWQLVPSTVFEAAPGSGIAFSPTGLNQVRIPPGDQFVILTVRLSQVPGNCPQQGCQGQIQTRMINLNTDQSPFFKQASFTMLTAQ